MDSTTTLASTQMVQVMAPPAGDSTFSQSSPEVSVSCTDFDQGAAAAAPTSLPSWVSPEP